MDYEDPHPRPPRSSDPPPNPHSNKKKQYILRNKVKEYKERRYIRLKSCYSSNKSNNIYFT